MVVAGDEVAPFRVLGARANFAQQSASHQPSEPGAGGPGIRPMDRSDVAGQSTDSVRARVDEGLIADFERGTVDLSGEDRHAKSALHAAAPPLDDAERVKDAPDDAVAQLGDAVLGLRWLGRTAAAQDTRPRSDHRRSRRESERRAAHDQRGQLP